MFHKGLDREQVVEAAKELIEERGYESFSMRELADKLGVKTASLYAHVESMEALLTAAGLSALQEQRDYELAAICGKRRDEAVLSLADSYREYAKAHRALYHFILKMPACADEELKQAAAMVTEPAMRVLADYALTDEQKMHWQRALRALMHGFVSQEGNGYFSHYPVDVEESYHIAVRCLIDGLHGAEAKNNAR